MVHDECYHQAMESHGGKWSARAAQQTAKCRKRKGIVRKTETGKNLQRWGEEQWKDEKGRPCGAGKKGETVKCRPSKKISSKTPATWSDVEKAGDKQRLVKEKKQIGMGKNTKPYSPRKKTSPKGDQKTSRGSFSEERIRKEKILYKPFPSKMKHKKYSVYVKNDNGNPKLIHFGDNRYQQYRDKIGHYSHLDHEDPSRRKNYRSRHSGEQYDKNKAGWWAWHKLW
jgi:hypothetical protein